MSEELEKRKAAAIETADQAFWSKIAEAFPEAIGGDFPPDAHVAWEKVMKSAVDVWVLGNVPGATEEEDDDDPTCPWCTEKVRPGEPAVAVSKGYHEGGEFQIPEPESDDFYHKGCWDTLLEHTKSEEELEGDDHAIRRENESRHR